MEATEDVLHQFYELENKPDRKYFVLAAILILLQNAVSLFLFMLSFQVAGIDTNQLFSDKIFLFQLFLFRALPITGLLMFLWRKKAGWVIVLFFSLYDWLQKFYFSADAIIHFERHNPLNPVLHWGIFLTFLLSGAIVVLLLFKNVRQLFNISFTWLYSTVTVSAIVFFFVRFYITGLLMNHIHSK